MTITDTLTNKVYAADAGRKLSMQDLLDYFAQQGKMRVSDLHLKVGCPPVYRVDGALQRMKGTPLDAGTMETLARSLLSEGELAALKTRRSVDSSCSSGEMQFRLNCFHDNNGMAIAIRALEAEPPPIEEIGFPNGVWRDIVNKQQGLVLLTGITGAGKSTTIASLIDQIAQKRA